MAAMLVTVTAVFLLCTPCLHARRNLTTIRAKQSGHFILGGIFPVHVAGDDKGCSSFNQKALSWVQAMIYAVNYYNQQDDILPGIKLGYDISDSCNQLDRAIEASLDFILGPTSFNTVDSFFFIPSNPSHSASHYITGPKLDAGSNVTSDVGPKFDPPNNVTSDMGVQFDPFDNVTIEEPTLGTVNATVQSPLPESQVRTSEACCSFNTATRSVANVIAAVGCASSSLSMATATIFSAMFMPQISYSSTSRLLSDKAMYRSFLRTIPTDVKQVEAMADLVAHFGWKYVATVASDDVYGKLGIESFKQAIKKRDTCIARSDVFPMVDYQSAMTQIVQQLNQTESGRKAKIIVLFCSNHLAQMFLREAERQNLRGKLWIASESWADDRPVLQLNSRVMTGTLGFVPQAGDLSGFQKYLQSISMKDLYATNPWFDELMQMGRHCSKYGRSQEAYNASAGARDNPADYPNCARLYDEQSHHADMFVLGKVQYVIDAVGALAHALHAMLCKPTMPCKLPTRFAHWEYLRFVQNVSFQGTTGTVKFDSDGEPPGNYSLNNIQLDADGQLVWRSVGDWSSTRTGKRLILDDVSNISWPLPLRAPPNSICSEDCAPGFYRLFGSTPCCWYCVRCEFATVSNVTNAEDCYACPFSEIHNDNYTTCVPKYLEYLRWTDVAAIGVTFLAACTMIMAAGIFVVFIIYGQTPVVKGCNRNLSLVLVVGLALSSVLPFLYVGEPDTMKCRIQPVYFGVTFSLCLSILLTKTEQVVHVFYAKLQDVVGRNNRFASLNRQWFIVISLTIIEAVIGLSYTILHPAEVVVDMVSHAEFGIVHCDHNWLNAQVICMSYVALLSLICTFLAFKARKLPASFNEAKVLSFCMFMICLIWIVSLPAYFGPPGKNSIAIICYAVIGATMFILGFMFVPKLHIIFFKPYKNTSIYVRSQTTTHSMAEVTDKNAVNKTANSKQLVKQTSKGFLSLRPSLPLSPREPDTPNRRISEETKTWITCSSVVNRTVYHPHPVADKYRERDAITCTRL